MENNERLMSLDALRGADMLFIMGFSGVLIALCPLLGFSKDCWLATQMTHVAWHGIRQHDTIFPMFLFLAGVSWPFSFSGQQARGRTTGRIVCKIIIRVFFLSLLGLMRSEAFWKFDFASVRYDSILAHIGICWAVAALLTMFIRSFWTRLAIVAALLVAHFLAFVLFSAPDAASLLTSTDADTARRVASYAAYGTDNFSFTGNIAGWIDRTYMPGRLSEVVFDADGLLAKVTGIAIALCGMSAGELLRRQDASGWRKTFLLLGAGGVCMILSWAWSPWCVINKKLWTSSFSLAAVGYSLVALALFYCVIDVLHWRRWAFPFRVLGMNSISIYMLMYFVGFYAISKKVFAGVASFGDTSWASMVYALGQVLIEWLVLLWFYRKNTFLRV